MIVIIIHWQTIILFKNTMYREWMQIKFNKQAQLMGCRHRNRIRLLF